MMFVTTSMPIGGMETLLVELIRRLDRSRFEPELCCLKHFDVLGEVVAQEMPAFSGLLKHKYDVAVLWRLKKLMRHRRIDAVITVGAGDKMFWGRLAAWLAGVPVDLFGIALDGRAGSRRVAKSAAVACDRRLYCRGRSARPVSGGT